MKKLVVLTGAGMSAESGIRTFRDSDGLWEEYNVMDVCTPEAWQRDPELVNRFYNERRKQLYEAQPNAGHFGLAELEKTSTSRSSRKTSTTYTNVPEVLKYYTCTENSKKSEVAGTRT